MTAASFQSPTTPSLNTDGRASEPSMEDILASIRRIIADDHVNNGRGGAPRRAAPAPEPQARDVAPVAPAARAAQDDVLDLARYAPLNGAAKAPDVADAPAETAPVVQHDDGDAHDFAAHGYEQGDEHQDLQAYATEGEADALPLLSQPIGDTVSSAFETLAATVVLENKPLLERILRDLMRPMLKAWLDENLPSLVERLVRSEIERVARGGRA